ncbi:MAG: hypothetical protein JKX78_12520 [Alteromonadaceae bacterium]|nr:hypothetical protein [Alteromonadaceae bacterium]
MQNTTTGAITAYSRALISVGVLIVMIGYIIGAGLLVSKILSLVAI